MIYIISHDSDKSSSDVIEWLSRFNKDCIRVNDIIGIEGHKLFLQAKKSYELQYTFGVNAPLNSIWFRKSNHFEFISNSDLKEYYRRESKKLINYIFSTENKQNSILGTAFAKDINKLNLLIVAEQFDLSIPDTIVTNNKRELLDFSKKYKKIITKPISEIFTTKLDGKDKVTYTKFITKEFSRSLPKIFPVSLFQQYIEKEYEIRIFYLDGKLYPMAIFSQSSNKTKVDFRNYDYKKPNRCVPYALPKYVELKLLSYMANLKFEASSIDMIKCRETGNYYFLEVNPWGQFGMVSDLCNYYIEKKIAEVL